MKFTVAVAMRDLSEYIAKIGRMRRFPMTYREVRLASARALISSLPR